MSQPFEPRARDPLAPDKTIASRSNALVNEWLESLTAKGIRKHGVFLVAGEKAVRETLERAPQLARSLFLCADRHVPALQPGLGPASGPDSWRSLIARARELTSKNDPRFSVISLARPIFDELDISGTHDPLLLTHTPDIGEADLSVAPVGLEILCALGDPSNVGALLRSAAAFGASRIILLKECASPFHPKAVRAASAATMLTQLSRGPSIRGLPDLASEGALAGPILALDMQGKGLSTFKWPTNARLLIGEEGQGVPSSANFEFLSIPMAKDVESLNATVAASVALYSYSQRV
jgi:TrmH family RNA methyltransferase